MTPAGTLVPEPWSTGLEPLDALLDGGLRRGVTYGTWDPPGYPANGLLETALDGWLERTSLRVVMVGGATESRIHERDLSRTSTAVLGSRSAPFWLVDVDRVSGATVVPTLRSACPDPDVMLVDDPVWIAAPDDLDLLAILTDEARCRGAALAIAMHPEFLVGDHPGWLAQKPAVGRRLEALRKASDVLLEMSPTSHPDRFRIGRFGDEASGVSVRFGPELRVRLDG